MGEPKLVSRDFSLLVSLSLSLSFRLVLVENANLIARRAISGLSSIRFDQTRVCLILDFRNVLDVVVEWRVLLRRIDNLGGNWEGDDDWKRGFLLVGGISKGMAILGCWARRLLNVIGRNISFI